MRSELIHAAAALRTPLPANATTTQRIGHTAHLYGGALASLKQRDGIAAMRFASAARASHGIQDNRSLPGSKYAEFAIELIAIECLLSLPTPTTEQRSQAATALANLRSMPSAFNQRPAVLAWAQLASTDLLPNASAERSQAIDALQIWLAEHPRDAPAWQALAALQEAQGQTLRSLRAAAEARVALFDYSAALDRLKAAQEWARINPTHASANHIDASIIDTRARAVQILLREQQRERDKP